MSHFDLKKLDFVLGINTVKDAMIYDKHYFPEMSQFIYSGKYSNIVNRMKYSFIVLSMKKDLVTNDIHAKYFNELKTIFERNIHLLKFLETSLKFNPLSKFKLQRKEIDDIFIKSAAVNYMTGAKTPLRTLKIQVDFREHSYQEESPYTQIIPSTKHFFFQSFNKAKKLFKFFDYFCKFKRRKYKIKMRFVGYNYTMRNSTRSKAPFKFYRRKDKRYRAKRVNTAIYKMYLIQNFRTNRSKLFKRFKRKYQYYDKTQYSKFESSKRLALSKYKKYLKLIKYKRRKRVSLPKKKLQNVNVKALKTLKIFARISQIYENILHLPARKGLLKASIQKQLASVAVPKTKPIRKVTRTYLKTKIDPRFKSVYNIQSRFKAKLNSKKEAKLKSNKGKGKSKFKVRLHVNAKFKPKGKTIANSIYKVKSKYFTRITKLHNSHFLTVTNRAYYDR